MNMEKIMENERKSEEVKLRGENYSLVNNAAVALFVDYPNLVTYAIDHKQFLDMGRILTEAGKYGSLIMANVYISLQTDSSLTTNVLKLERLGYHVVIRPVSNTVYGKKKDIDTYLATDALVALYNHNADTIIIASGDSDFVPVIREIRRNKRKAVSFVCCLNQSLVIASASNEYRLIEFSDFIKREKEREVFSETEEREVTVCQ